jgi:hypothetical protein
MIYVIVESRYLVGPFAEDGMRGLDEAGLPGRVELEAFMAERAGIVVSGVVGPMTPQQFIDHERNWTDPSWVALDENGIITSDPMAEKYGYPSKVGQKHTDPFVKRNELRQAYREVFGMAPPSGCSTEWLEAELAAQPASKMGTGDAGGIVPLKEGDGEALMPQAELDRNTELDAAREAYLQRFGTQAPEHYEAESLRYFVEIGFDASNAEDRKTSGSSLSRAT